MPGQRPTARAFTILELMVSMAILGLLVLLLTSISNNVAKLWKDTAGNIAEWRGARTAFEAMNRKLSQATLNTTWAYFDSSGVITSSDPSKYGRYSELEFVTGPARTLTGLANTTSQAVFFQAPLGQTTNTSLRGLPNLLNSCGYFVQFNSDASFRPSLAIFGGVREKWRFRLMELIDPSESSCIYSFPPPTTNYTWFRSPINTGRARPLAENVVALILLPKLSAFDDTGTGSLIAPGYGYDSRTSFSFSSGGVPGNTLHQLPPLLLVSMVVLDERSAQRLEAQSGSSQPDLFAGAPFTQASQYQADLSQLEKNLLAQNLRYRIFSTVVPIRGAKWSPDTP